MKILIPILLTVFVQSQGLYESFESFDKDSRNRYIATTTYEFDVSKAEGNNRVVEFKHVTGDITVEGKPITTVTIIERMKIRTKSRSIAEDYFKSEKAEVSKSGEGHIEFRRENNSPRRLKISYDYDVVVPQNYNLSMKTSGGDIDVSYISGEAYLKTSGGNVDVSHLTGRLTAKTSGGDITLDKVKGVANVRTSGGDIEVNDSDGKLEGTTSGGDVDITYCKAEVDMHTSGGNIDFKDIIGSKIYGRTSGGNIDVTGIEGDVDVHTSGGNIEAMDIKGEFEGSASGGNIEFDRIMGHIDVNTSGGNIIGEHVVGRIIGKTSGGRIEIEKIWNRSFDDHEIYLKTSGGKIELRLPSDFPATIDATVINRRSTGAIDSEFPLQITLDDNDVLANGSINGGKFSVKLKTSHDSISIEKD